MEYQNQVSDEEQSLTPQSEKHQSSEDPTSEGRDGRKQEVVNNANVISEDAPSRLRDESQEETQPQIDEEGGFKNKAGWTREEGLSDEERGNAEEEDLNGRHSGDNSIL